ncbi:flavin monoamine oxidase family protein [Thermoflavimicrobium daqui]|uniref:Monoamine oxidase n=1 Tax=Thermoflavimicrobium daqui TaxID=2137476 RepID=A0A364K9J9_9BACL|nr:FAD-dependent oxidoreductase [Thermoflavimicrobium daqui]RAL26892.1 monoamine oxidase [Thermoflavimicrobium daqui]
MRTPLLRSLRKASSIAAESFKRGVPIDEVITNKSNDTSNCGESQKKTYPELNPFIPNVPKNAPSNPPEKVVIVGAGLAGLTCAYRLKKAGINTTIYEAAHRLGGRCWSERNYFNAGQIVERGGEFINTEHFHIRHLVNELGLRLDNVQEENQETKTILYFHQTPYTMKEVAEDLKRVYPLLHRDQTAIKGGVYYNHYSKRAWELDHMSINDWIKQNVPGGIGSKLGTLLNIAYTTEYGAEASDQSALNLILLMSCNHIIKSDEAYHVHGGNDQIITRLAKELQTQIKTGHQLVGIKKNPNHSYTLTFKYKLHTKEITADKVVLAIPFTILRSSVDYSQANFHPLKQIAIEEKGMGNNTKFQLQFTKRHWRDLGYNGSSFSDTGYQCTWEVTRAQAGKPGILNNFTGGATAKSFTSNSSQKNVDEFLQQIESIFPGLSSWYNGKFIINPWSQYQWTKGSHTYYRVGQYTKFAGIESEPEENCYFAGEHTSYQFMGFLNGAVESGERVAYEILRDLKGTHDPSLLVKSISYNIPTLD